MKHKAAITKLLVTRQPAAPVLKLQIDPDKILDYFSVQSCLWTAGQDFASSFLA